MITLALVLNHRNKKRKTMPIEVRIIYGRKPYYISTGVRVRKDEFKNGLVVNRPDAPELNERVESLTRNINIFVNKLISEGKPIDCIYIRKNAWNLIPASDNNILTWIRNEIPMLNLAETTQKRYICLVKRLEEFAKIQTFSDLTVEMIYMFDSWLHTRPSQSGLGKISDAGIYNYHKCLKSLLNRAVRMQKIDSNPYDRMRGTIKKGENASVEYLTDDEMQKIEMADISAGTLLAKARDLFIFQMYTGLSYADTQNFDFSRYKKVKGVYTAIDQRIKTGAPYVSDLLPQAVEVLKQYNWRPPKIDNADYNHMLKALQSMTKISTRLHSHLARHTFATFMLRNGVKIENVSKMLGHTNITQTQRYAKVMALSVHEEFQRINNKLLQQQ